MRSRVSRPPDQGGVYVHPAKGGVEGHPSDNEGDQHGKEQIHGHALHTLENALHAKIPTPTDRAEASQTAGRMSKGV